MNSAGGSGGAAAGDNKRKHRAPQAGPKAQRKKQRDKQKRGVDQPKLKNPKVQLQSLCLRAGSAACPVHVLTAAAYASPRAPAGLCVPC